MAQWTNAKESLAGTKSERVYRDSIHLTLPPLAG